MTRAERLKAYKMRLDGMTWNAIGEALHYDGNSVYKDLLRSLQAGKKQAKILYPKIRKICYTQFDGSLSRMAAHLALSDSTFRNQMKGKSAPSFETIQAVTKTFGISCEEAFQKEEAP